MNQLPLCDCGELVTAVAYSPYQKGIMMATAKNPNGCCSRFEGEYKTYKSSIPELVFFISKNEEIKIKTSGSMDYFKIEGQDMNQEIIEFSEKLKESLNKLSTTSTIADEALSRELQFSKELRDYIDGLCSNTDCSNSKVIVSAAHFPPGAYRGKDGNWQWPPRSSASEERSRRNAFVTSFFIYLDDKIDDVQQGII